MGELEIDANVIIPSTLSMNGSVRTNSINAGVTIVAVNGEDLPIVDGRVDISVPTKFSELENDIQLVSEQDVVTMLADYQEKLFVQDQDTLIIP